MAITNTSLTINNGDEATASQIVTLDIFAEGSVWAFIVSEHPDFIGATWQMWPAGRTSLEESFILSPKSPLTGVTFEQQRTIFVAFSDNEDDIGKLFDPTNSFGDDDVFNRGYVASATANDDIILDTVAPTPVGPDGAGILINNGDVAAYSRVVQITSYMLNAVQMRIAEVAVSETEVPNGTPWITYTPNIEGFVLSESAGNKKVVAQYRDNVGNISEVQSAQIAYAASAPDYTVQLNQGATHTFSPLLNVSVTISDTDILTDLDAVWISEFENFAVRDEYGTPDLPDTLNAPFNYSFTTTGGEGLKTVYVRLYDSGGDFQLRATSIFLDTTTPNIDPSTVPDGQIVVINPQTGGQATNDPQVKVVFEGVVSAQSVIISNDPGFSGAEWQPFTFESNNPQNGFTHALDASTDGLKFVYAQFSDADEVGALGDAVGNVTPSYVGSISFDTVGPIIPLVSDCTAVGYGYCAVDGYAIDGYTGDGVFIEGVPRAVIINNDDPYVLLEPTTVNGITKFYVQLQLNAIDATQMKLSTELEDDGTIPSGILWQAFKATEFFDLPPEEGIATVYVQFRDDAGNETAIYNDSIEVVDGRPVVPGNLGPFAILINGGDEKTNSQTVTLTLNAEAEPTLEMIISESDTFADAVWEPYQTTKSYTFNNNDNGNKIVFVKYRILLKDLFFRESAIYSDSIIFDTAAPEIVDPGMLIDGGRTFTRDRQVNLAFNVRNAEDMQIANENEFDPADFSTLTWIPFSEQVAWMLSIGNGDKRVYARFRDDVGNTTVFISAAITLNSDIPAAPVIVSPAPGSVLKQRVIKVEGTAEPGAVVSITVRPLNN